MVCLLCSRKAFFAGKVTNLTGAVFIFLYDKGVNA